MYKFDFKVTFLGGSTFYITHVSRKGHDYIVHLYKDYISAQRRDFFACFHCCAEYSNITDQSAFRFKLKADGMIAPAVIYITAVWGRARAYCLHRALSPVRGSIRTKRLNLVKKKIKFSKNRTLYLPYIFMFIYYVER